MSEEAKNISFNRIKDVVLNSDNELKHMKPIRGMVQKFEDDYGASNLSTSLWIKYHQVYNIITLNQ